MGEQDNKPAEKEGNTDMETAAVAGFVGFMFAGPVGSVIGVASGAMYSRVVV